MKIMLIGFMLTLLLLFGPPEASTITMGEPITERAAFTHN